MFPALPHKLPLGHTQRQLHPLGRRSLQIYTRSLERCYRSNTSVEVHQLQHNCNIFSKQKQYCVELEACGVLAMGLGVCRTSQIQNISKLIIKTISGISVYLCIS